VRFRLGDGVSKERLAGREIPAPDFPNSIGSSLLSWRSVSIAEMFVDSSLKKRRIQRGKEETSHGELNAFERLNSYLPICRLELLNGPTYLPPYSLHITHSHFL